MQEEVKTKLQALRNSNQQPHAHGPYLIFILHEVFLYLLCLNLASYQSLMTLLYVKLFEGSKLKARKKEGRGKKPVNLSCRERCYNLNEKQHADR